MGEVRTLNQCYSIPVIAIQSWRFLWSVFEKFGCMRASQSKGKCVVVYYEVTQQENCILVSCCTGRHAAGTSTSERPCSSGSVWVRLWSIIKALRCQRLGSVRSKPRTSQMVFLLKQILSGTIKAINKHIWNSVENKASVKKTFKL